MSYSNEASWDRAIRILLGLVMIVVGWFVVDDGLTSAVLRIFGFLPLVTGLLGWDPFYALFGFATKSARRLR